MEPIVENLPPVDLMKLPPKERNKVYRGLTPRQKSVAIAKDVIAQLDAKMFVAEHCTYFKLSRDPDEQSLQAELESKSCKVCAIGATFASAVRLGNSATVDGLENSDSESSYMFTKTRGALSGREQRAMEVVFEGTSVLQRSIFNSTQLDLLINYRNTFTKNINYTNRDTSPDAIMRGIMQNIIANDGVFLVEGVDLKNLEKK